MSAVGVNGGGSSVVLSRHALERLGERRPALTEEDVICEVRAAIGEGRVACRVPRPLAPPGRRPRSSPSSGRFAWSADFRQLYVVHRSRQRKGGHAWVVVTVLDTRSVAGLGRGFLQSEVE